MSRFLLDANLSPKTRIFLADRFGFGVDDLLSRNQALLSDAEVVELARREHRVIITFDKGFGERYFVQERGTLGIIVLRLSDQSRLNVERALEHFFQTQASGIDLDSSLVTIENIQTRVVGVR